MEVQHVKAVALMAANKALNHVTLRSSTSVPSFYFSQKKIEDALTNKNIAVLRAAIAKQASRTNEEDLPFLFQAASESYPELNVDAVRCLALRCCARAQTIFETHAHGDAPINRWAQRGLACLKAQRLGLTPPREKAPVEVRD